MRIKPGMNPFNASVNIERDTDRELVYHPTENAKRTFQQIINDIQQGIHVFTIIGSYGTGKSSFLWAFEQNILNRKPYFGETTFSKKSVDVIKLVGEYGSLLGKFTELAKVDPNSSVKEIFASFFYHYQNHLKEGLVVLMIDEFGKFLEYAAKNDPEKELYFIQQLAEFSSDPRYNLLLITTIHQNFDAYALGLTVAQRQEWSKVKGRFRELTFNEPVTELLRLAADHIRTVASDYTADDEFQALQMADLLRRSKAFELSNNVTSELALDLLPLDLFSANVLTIAMQRYGQNERSLFSFLSSSDHTSISKISRKSQFFHLGHVYDYLLFNFYSFIQSKYNPDFSAWKAIRNCLDEVERVFESGVEEISNIIKTIALLDLTTLQGSSLDRIFLTQYASLCLGAKRADVLIDKLKSKNIIIFRDHLQRFSLNQGTSLDVEAALIEAATKVDQVSDIATLLRRYYSLPPVLAKSYSYETGTPRLFEFVITDKLKADIPTGEIDGYIYLVFNEKLDLEGVKDFSANAINDSSLYLFYENYKSISDLLFELEKLRKVREDNNDDKEAVRLLNESFDASKRALNYFIIGSLSSSNQHVKWVWNGKEQSVSNKRTFNELLSVVCRAAYPFTPVFNNELVNKHKISPSINTARKNYFRSLVKNWNKLDLGFEKEKFPPEKTIYLSLLKENNISVVTGNFIGDDLKNITPLWKASCQFIESAKERRRSLKDFVELLSTKPYKLKQGLISFWFPTFLFIKRDEFALFGENGYVPFITDEIIDLIIRYPEKYQIKAFNVDKTQLTFFNYYRTFLQLDNTDSLDNNIFIETMRPFLSFYRQLPEYTRTTKKLSKTALAFRNVISKTEDLELTFFEDFPEALGYNFSQLVEEPAGIELYVKSLESAVQEIRECFPKLVSRFEQLIVDRIVGEQLAFEDYKAILKKRYQQLAKHAISNDYKSFIQRILSNIDDRKSWLNSIAQVLSGKPLESFRDEDESGLHNKFLSMIIDLDKLCNLSSESFDFSMEDVLGFEINSLIDGVEKTVIRLPKSKRDEINKVKESIRAVIDTIESDNQMKLVALANLIKELIKS